MFELIIDGLVGEIISSGINTSKNKIKNVMENRKHKNIYTQLYHVIVNSLKRVANCEYNNSKDLIYEAAELLLKCFKDENKNHTECIMDSLKILCPNVTNDTCIDFKNILYDEICKTENIGLFHQILLNMANQQRKYNHKENAQIMQMLYGIDQQLKNMNLQEKKSILHRNNTKQDYINNWNSNLFLHNDKNPITLSKAFIPPNCKIHKENYDIGFSDKDTLEIIIEKFIEYAQTSCMLIAGVPGIGKTTITSWLASKFDSDDSVIILRFRDWEFDEIEKGLLKAICNILQCRKRDLNNMTLILDGFDEMKTIFNGNSLLSDFFNEIKDITNFKCIITSRPAYIDSYYFDNVLELEKFDIRRVKTFVSLIQGNELNIINKIEPNLEVLGIPVILYMAIMSGVDIAQNPTKPELYNRIFSATGGIFDKFNYNGCQYDSGTQILRSPQNIKKYLKFLCESSFKMFEKNKLILSKEECHIPKLQFEGRSISVLEFPLKHLFERKDIDIEFIHNSIYEYFVSEYIFETIYKAIYANTSRKDLAGLFGKLLYSKHISPEIFEFLKYKIETKLKNKWNIVDETFKLMLDNGMTYYTKKRYKNIMECEMNVFSNMLKIIFLFDNQSLKFNYSIYKYLKYNKEHELNLKKANLSKLFLEETDLFAANLSGANLNETNLAGANIEQGIIRDASLIRATLTEANLQDADLQNADFRGAELKKVNMQRADLFKAKLIKSDLRDADLRDADLRNADLRGANLQMTNLWNADLRNADLRDAELQCAKLIGANITNASFNKFQISILENEYDFENTNIKIYIEELQEFINYDEYNRKYNQ